MTLLTLLSGCAPIGRETLCGKPRSALTGGGDGAASGGGFGDAGFGEAGFGDAGADEPHPANPQAGDCRAGPCRRCRADLASG